MRLQLVESPSQDGRASILDSTSPLKKNNFLVPFAKEKWTMFVSKVLTILLSIEISGFSGTLNYQCFSQLPDTCHVFVVSKSLQSFLSESTNSLITISYPLRLVAL